MKKKLTRKEQEFVKHFTNTKDKETLLNATQSALKVYNATVQSAGQIGYTKLKKVEIQEAIAKRISTKEEDQEGLTRLGEKIEQALNETDLTPERAVFFKVLSSEYHKNKELSARFRGDLVEKSVNINVNATLDFSGSADQALSDDGV